MSYGKGQALNQILPAPIKKRGEKINVPRQTEQDFYPITITEATVMGREKTGPKKKNLIGDFK